jgi:arylformamidase
MIYKHYDQAALDRQYNNRLLVPEFPAHLRRWDDWSREAESTLNHAHDIPYGDGARERLDVYPSRIPASKVLVFIHGGYWHKLDKSGFQFIAEAFHRYDITVVLVGYPLAPAASMDEIVASCRKALHWVYENIGKHQGDPSAIFLAGHSAGGHLAAMMLTTDWSQVYINLPQNLLKGVATLSGLFNLRPIQLSEVNAVLNLNDDMVTWNSPVKLQPREKCPLLIAVGGDESDEFLDQSSELKEVWSGQLPIDFLRLQGINHYSIMAALREESSPLHLAVRKMILGK